MFGDDACRTANRLRLGLPLTNKTHRVQCVCGADAGGGDHFMVCNRVKGGAIIDRHNAVMKVLTKHIQLVNGRAKEEPKGLDPGSRERPDIDVFLGSSEYLIDVMVTHPTAASNVNVAMYPLGAALKGETMKSKKHKDKARGGAIFVPYVVETYGGTGRQAS